MAPSSEGSCPVCGYRLDEHRGLNTDADRPRPGDLTLCGNCGTLLEVARKNAELSDEDFDPVYSVTSPVAVSQEPEGEDLLSALLGTQLDLARRGYIRDPEELVDGVREEP